MASSFFAFVGGFCGIYGLSSLRQFVLINEPNYPVSSAPHFYKPILIYWDPLKPEG